MYWILLISFLYCNRSVDYFCPLVVEPSFFMPQQMSHTSLLEVFSALLKLQTQNSVESRIGPLNDND